MIRERRPSGHSQAYNPADGRVRLDTVYERIEQVVAVFALESEPRYATILHDAVGIERHDQFPERIVALTVLANQTADGAFAEFAKVIVEMADGAVDRTIQRMIGGERQGADLVDGFEELRLRLPGNAVHRRDRGGLVPGQDVVDRLQGLPRIHAEALVVTDNPFRRRPCMCSKGESRLTESQHSVLRRELGRI